jgi:hypothetical protein
MAGPWIGMEITKFGWHMGACKSIPSDSGIDFSTRTMKQTNETEFTTTLGARGLTKSNP